jgi:hypothetical protein
MRFLRHGPCESTASANRSIPLSLLDFRRATGYVNQTRPSLFQEAVNVSRRKSSQGLGPVRWGIYYDVRSNFL